MTFFMTLMIITNTVFLMLNHPLSMGLTLIIQTALAAAMAGIIAGTFWFSYLLILIFLGGMLILFVYVSTLAPNESLDSPSPQISLTLIFLCGFLFLSYLIPSHLSSNDSDFYATPFSWMASGTLLYLFAFIIIFLFLVLVAIVKITKFWTGPLRPMNK